MAEENICVFIGGLGSDGEIKTVGDNNKVYNNSMAVTKKVKGADVTTWINIRAWGKTAELISNYTRKGSQIYIRSEFGLDSWDGKDGKKNYKPIFTINKVQFLSKPSGSNDKPKQESQAPIEMNDDLVF